MTKYVLGIDPGQEGCITVLPVDRSGRLQPQKTSFYLIPNIETEDGLFIDSKALNNLLSDLDSSKCLVAGVEKQWSRPGHSSKTSDKLMFNYGTLITLLEVNGFKVRSFGPTVWQSAVRKPVIENFGLKVKDKEQSIRAVAYLFPHVDVGRNHNVADALLIGRYAYELLQKEMR